MVVDQRLEKAEALLAKARSTGFAPERDAFAAGAYDQLSAYLAAMGASRPERVPPPELPASSIDRDPFATAAAEIPASLGSTDDPVPADPPIDANSTWLRAATQAYRSLGHRRQQSGVVIDLTI